jgi:hypothetical protein
MTGLAAVTKPTHWSAVSILSTGASCEAARALKGKRFLSAEAPRLPLIECTQSAQCRCTYKKYPDRRAGPRREEDATGLRRAVPEGKERRAKRGRRSTDE